MPSSRRTALLGLIGLSLILVGSLSVLVARTIEQEKEAGARLGEHAPSFKLPDRNGKPVSLSSFRGKVVIMVFVSPRFNGVASYHQAIANLTRQYAGDDRVRFLLISNGLDSDKPEAVQAMARTLPSQFVTLIDSQNEISNRYGVQSLPTCCVVGPVGGLRFRGAITDAQEENKNLITDCMETIQTILVSMADFIR